MVSSLLPGLTKTQMSKPLQSQSLFSVDPLDVEVPENVELDFADVFGPLPVQTPTEVDCDDLLFAGDANEIIYDDPVVIYKRSHSLVGPSACVSQSLKLSKLNLHEAKDPMELVECVQEDTIKELNKSSTYENVVGKAIENVNEVSLEVRSIGIEDFEVLKVVGQGAFGKVYQVRKKGTSEIYAMKVMRKDRIVEKNHVEYMKAERDILTKIDHPFIVQLKYSFQVIFHLIVNYNVAFLRG